MALPVQAMRLAKPKLSNVEKKAKALSKKLQQIATLKARQVAGETMDSNQLEKIASEEDVRDDLKAWEDACSTPKAGSESFTGVTRAR